MLKDPRVIYVTAQASYRLRKGTVLRERPKKVFQMAPETIANLVYNRKQGDIRMTETQNVYVDCATGDVYFAVKGLSRAVIKDIPGDLNLHVKIGK